MGANHYRKSAITLPSKCRFHVLQGPGGSKRSVAESSPREANPKGRFFTKFHSRSGDCANNPDGRTREGLFLGYSGVRPQWG
jgi:hypothetical protein